MRAAAFKKARAVSAPQLKKACGSMLWERRPLEGTAPKTRKIEAVICGPGMGQE